jgi:hypothetical protein
MSVLFNDDEVVLLTQDDDAQSVGATVVGGGGGALTTDKQHRLLSEVRRVGRTTSLLAIFVIVFSVVANLVLALVLFFAKTVPMERKIITVTTVGLFSVGCWIIMAASAKRNDASMLQIFSVLCGITGAFGLGSSTALC